MASEISQLITAVKKDKRFTVEVLRNGRYRIRRADNGEFVAVIQAKEGAYSGLRNAVAALRRAERSI